MTSEYPPTFHQVPPLAPGLSDNYHHPIPMDPNDEDRDQYEINPYKEGELTKVLNLIEQLAATHDERAKTLRKIIKITLDQKDSTDTMFQMLKTVVALPDLGITLKKGREIKE